MDTNLKYAWQQAVVDAFMEFQPQQLRKKILSAEKTIVERLSELGQADPEEQAALRDALHALRVFLPPKDV